MFCEVDAGSKFRAEVKVTQHFAPVFSHEYLHNTFIMMIVEGIVEIIVVQPFVSASELLV